MKLAEALILRSDAQKRLTQIQERLLRSAKVQEGEQPFEQPNDLFVELDRTLTQFRDIIQRINRTNSQTAFAAGTLTDALAERDTLVAERNVLGNLMRSLAGANETRYSRSEIKTVVTLNVAELQTRIDDLARRHRELDTAIQRFNWETDVL